MSASQFISGQPSASARCEIINEDTLGRRVLVAFTAQGWRRPAIWSPAFGRPAATPMNPDGRGRWRLELDLPSDANASWAAVSDAAQAAMSFPSRLHARFSVAARVALGTRLDQSFSLKAPVSPSLYRMIGTDPEMALEPNIGTIPTPHVTSFDPADLARPALPRLEVTVAGHRFAPAPAGDEALLLDGEVLRRSAGDLAGTNWSFSYLNNQSAISRMRDNVHPLAYAAKLLPGLEAAGSKPLVVVGTSATAPTALALALHLKAKRAVLLSPAFPSHRARQRLVNYAASAGIRIDVHAGSEEHGGGNPRRSIRDSAQTFVQEVQSRGGMASFTEFAGGHDLPAWRVALVHALNQARAALTPASQRKEAV